VAVASRRRSRGRPCTMEGAEEVRGEAARAAPAATAAAGRVARSPAPVERPLSRIQVGVEVAAAIRARPAARVAQGWSSLRIRHRRSRWRPQFSLQTWRRERTNATSKVHRRLRRVCSPLSTWDDERQDRRSSRRPSGRPDASSRAEPARAWISRSTPTTVSQPTLRAVVSAASRRRVVAACRRSSASRRGSPVRFRAPLAQRKRGRRDAPCRRRAATTLAAPGDSKR